MSKNVVKLNNSTMANKAEILRALQIVYFYSHNLDLNIGDDCKVFNMCVLVRDNVSLIAIQYAIEVLTDSHYGKFISDRYNNVVAAIKENKIDEV